jgi:tetratricopeptide (TPR) repeat protein
MTSLTPLTLPPVELRPSSPEARPWAVCEALTDAGRAYCRLASPEPALALFAQALRLSSAWGSRDQSVDLLCEMAEAQAQHAEALARHHPGTEQPAQELARGHANEAATLVAGVADGNWEVTVLLRLSDLFNRLGDHADALRLQLRAMHRLTGQRPDAPAAPSHPTLQ